MKRKLRQRLGKVKCHCCKAYVSETERKLYTKAYNDWVAKTGEHYIKLENSLAWYHWTCDECVRIKKAILGNPNKQNYGGYDLPFFMYYDVESKCRDCDDVFVFSREERQFWYETLQFQVFSVATRCKKCRKDRKAMITRNNRIMQLTAIKDKSLAELKELAELYQELGSEQKANELLNQIKKRTKN